MVACSIRDCDVTGRNNPNGYTFHRLPSNPALREKWLRTINRPTWTPSKNSTICGKHFDGKCFIQRKHRRVLMKESIPTLFVPKMADKKKLYKCDKCIRTYTNSNALENHKRSMHGLNATSSPLKSRVNKTKAKIDKFERFQCPVCKAIFPSKFVATKHIEVYHKKHVKAGSIHSTKLQDCPNCKQKNRNLSLHKCTSDKQKNKITVGHNITNKQQTKTKKVHYFCYLCSKIFNTPKKFTVHVEAHHNKNVETMFFPNMTQFIYWKEHLERLANAQYRLSSEEINGRQFYHCINTKVTDVFTERCPSIIVVQSYPKGILARLYKNHARHKVSNYSLAKDFQKYRITEFLPSTDSSNGYDPYLDFKMLLESILQAAAKIKVSGLKELIEKALEMTVIINTHNEDNDDPLKLNHDQSKTLTDEQISEVLQTEETVSIKKENSDLDMPEPLKKKAHTIDVAPKIVNTYSLAVNHVQHKSDTDSCDENDIDTKILISNYVGKQKQKHNDNKRDLLDALKDREFSSFNDTYRDFVRKNLCLSTPMVTRSRVSQETINKKTKRKTTASSIPAAVTPKGKGIYENLKKSSERSTKLKKTSNSLEKSNHCKVNSTNISADCSVNPTNISTTSSNVHSGITPVVITPTPNHLMNNNMVFVAVPYAPVNTIIPTTTTNPYFNVVGVSMPQHITVTQQTLSTDFVPSIKKEPSPIKQENTQENETPNTEYGGANAEEEKGNRDIDISDAEDKKVYPKVEKKYTETSDIDDYEKNSEQKPKVKLEKMCKDIKSKRKVDYEYEVIEQDSDCNILVLKL